MRTAFHLLLCQGQNAFKVIFENHFFESPAALGIQPFSDEERWGFLLHRLSLHGGSQAGGLGSRPWRRNERGNLFDQLLEVLRCGSTAAANNIYAILCRKFKQRFSEGFRFQWIDRLPVDVQRQTCVGYAGHWQRAVLAQVADRFAHEIWTGGAVHPDHIDGKFFQDRQYSGNVRSQQHSPGCVQRDLCLDG